MSGLNYELKYELENILVTRSPFHNWTFQQYLYKYWHDKKHKHTLPSIRALKRMYPTLLIDEIVLAMGIAQYQLERE